MADNSGGFGGSGGNFNSSGFGSAGTGFSPSLSPGMQTIANGQQSLLQRNQLAQDKYATDTQANTAQQGFAAQLGAAQIGANAQMYGAGQQTQQAQIGAGAQEYGADQNTQQATIAANAQKYGVDAQTARFNQVYGLLQGGPNSPFGQGGLYNQYAGQGQVGTPPTISAAPVYSDAQIQQQVNTARANNDQKTAGQIQQMNSQLAGHGYGANSPLAAALGASYQGQNMQTNAANETSTRMNAAQMNSQQVLAGQQAQQAQFSDINNQDIQRNQINRQAQSAWLAALAGMA